MKRPKTMSVTAKGTGKSDMERFEGELRKERKKEPKNMPRVPATKTRKK